MSDSDQARPTWDPGKVAVRGRQRSAYDSMRETCPVAFSETMQWSLFRHEDLCRVLGEPGTFSNVVSPRRTVPNGMDPPEHTAYRRIIDGYFTPARMAAFEPACRGICGALIEGARQAGPVEVMEAVALPFAVQAQCAFLRWPETLHAPLIDWTRRNHAANHAQDRRALSAIAAEFEALIVERIAAARASGPEAPGDVVAELSREQVDGRPLGSEEIASILRNWTVGEIGSIAASAGILADHLARDGALQDRLRAEPALIEPACDEILRVDGPLVTNRRVVTRGVELRGRRFEAGDRITINWIAANRDPRAFADPEAVRLDRDPGANLLYGAGIHVCPGAPLARLELRVFLEELLARIGRLVPDPGGGSLRALYPASGYEKLFLRLA
ncbi:cytochrome P450 [Amaricoccus sp.]|uniref:cytochrome P450 n=1 Tax=Amaricoccus sp. TaxID=1872485 RepID=UPI002C1FFF0C|nr:cytochrome P450 [Amaricoccus sp.]HMQ93522.1 cytochrome P450 [Amaricoccus sp.]